MERKTIAIRDAFFDSLYDLAREDKNVILLTADCGAPSLDKFREDLREQYFSVGIAEQNMISIAAGLAMEGKIVYAYAIAPFASLRCYEQIKVDLCCMNLSVTMLGVGAGWAYDIMGPTHHSTEDVSIMRALPGMVIFNPSDSIMAGAMVQLSYKLPGPKYIRFDRGGLPFLYAGKKNDFSKGAIKLKEGKGLCIIATGAMVHRALEVTRDLSKHSIDAGVIDLFRLKPINEKTILKLISGYENILTLEEHLIIGGLGSAICEILSDNEVRPRLRRLGIRDKYYFEYGGRKRLHQLCGLDTHSIVSNILKWMGKRQ